MFGSDCDFRGRLADTWDPPTWPQEGGKGTPSENVWQTGTTPLAGPWSSLKTNAALGNRASRDVAGGFKEQVAVGSCRDPDLLLPAPGEHHSPYSLRRNQMIIGIILTITSRLPGLFTTKPVYYRNTWFHWWNLRFIYLSYAIIGLFVKAGSVSP